MGPSGHGRPLRKLPGTRSLAIASCTGVPRWVNSIVRISSWRPKVPRRNCHQRTEAQPQCRRFCTEMPWALTPHVAHLPLACGSAPACACSVCAWACAQEARSHRRAVIPTRRLVGGVVHGDLVPYVPDVGLCRCEGVAVHLTDPWLAALLHVLQPIGPAGAQADALLR